jgi:putative transposase
MLVNTRDGDAMMSDSTTVAVIKGQISRFSGIISKGLSKSAIWIARKSGRKKNFTGQNFWARGYCVSTAGLNEETVMEYIQRQEEEDKRLDQLKIFDE